MYNWMHIVFLCIFIKGSSCEGPWKKCRVKFDLNLCHPVDIYQMRNTTCDQVEVCHKIFNVSSIKMEPYNIRILYSLLRTCCGQCTRVAQVNLFETVSQVTPSNMNNSHFVFPVLGPAAAVRLHGYYFVPFVEPPILYYITAKTNVDVVNLLMSFHHIWPVIAMCILLAVISGFVCWLIETWNNKDQFPRAFLSGWFEGFWWSFVTMTTVGYGDKTPKSIPGRIFTVLWILVGIHICSIITAEFVAEIHRVNYPTPPKLAGSRVGALRFRTYDASVIAKHGGILIDFPSPNNTEAIFKLIRMLEKKQIDGFILDRYTYITFSRFVDMRPEVKRKFINEITFLRESTVQIEERTDGHQLSFGILVKNLEDYEYLADFVADNTATINTCNGLIINRLTMGVALTMPDAKHNLLLTTSGGIFWPFLVIVVTTVIVITCFGALYEVYRWKSALHQCDSPYASNI